MSDNKIKTEKRFSTTGKYLEEYIKFNNFKFCYFDIQMIITDQIKMSNSAFRRLEKL